MAFTTVRETPSLTNKEEKAEKTRLLEEHDLLIAKIATSKEQVKNAKDLSDEIALKQAQIIDCKKQLSDLETSITNKKLEKELVDKSHTAVNDHLAHVTNLLGTAKESLVKKQTEIINADNALQSKQKMTETHAVILNDLKTTITEHQTNKQHLEDSISSLKTTTEKVQSDLNTVKSNLTLVKMDHQETNDLLEHATDKLEASKSEFSDLLKKKEEAQKFIENSVLEAKTLAEKLISDAKEALENKEKLLAAQLDEVSLQSKMFSSYKAKLRAWKEEVESQTGTKLPITIPE